MTFLTKLDTVNELLAIAGETPLNALDEGHDLVQAALKALRIASYREQSKSWWFNQESITLVPDAVSGFIYLPDDTIRMDPLLGSLNYVQRGRRLYQPYASGSTSKYVFTHSVSCWLVRHIEFEDLPVAAQLFVQASAKQAFQLDFDGDPQKTGELRLEYRDALITLNAEHTRNRNVNLLRRPSTARMLNAIGVQANPAGLPLH
jgi:hypothetical protein